MSTRLVGALDESLISAQVPSTCTQLLAGVPTALMPRQPSRARTRLVQSQTDGNSPYAAAGPASEECASAYETSSTFWRTV